MRAKKNEANLNAIPVAQNTLMLYQVNSDQSKVEESERATIGLFMPYPDMWADSAVDITITMRPRVAKSFLRHYKNSKPYVKYAVSAIIRQIEVLAKR